MDIQYQTCTREQGARLVELGVKPAALFWHMPAKAGPHGEYVQYGWSSEATAPAFTVAELGDMLPARFITYKSTDKYDLLLGRYYGSSQRIGECGRVYGDTEAQVRAARLIHLLASNMIAKDELPAPWRQDPTSAEDMERVKQILSHAHNAVPGV